MPILFHLKLGCLVVFDYDFITNNHLSLMPSVFFKLLQLKSHLNIYGNAKLHQLAESVVSFSVNEIWMFPFSSLVIISGQWKPKVVNIKQIKW